MPLLTWTKGSKSLIRTCTGTETRKDNASVSGLEGIDFLHQTGLEVGGFVLVDHASLSQLVDHGGHGGQILGGLALFADGADVAQRVAHGLGVVAVS